MMAASGFNPMGTGIALGASELQVVLLSHEAEYDIKGERKILVKPALEAWDIDISRAYIGNTAGVVTPTERRLVDANHDGLKDVALTYPVHAIAALKKASESITQEMIEAGAIWDGHVGLHVWGANHTGFLVDDIFASGAPVVLARQEDEPDIGKDGLSLDTSSQAESPVHYDNDIASIYPNPFNPRTTVQFTLADEAQVTIAVYDVNGALVRTLVDNRLPSGEHTADWDGTDMRGRAVATGVYFARMVTPGFETTRKMVLLK
jgi:hypothetical protein